MKLKFFIAGAAIVAGLASAVSCQDLSKDLTALQNKVKSLESTVQNLQDKIDGGAVITSVTPTNSGIVITLSNGNKYEITNGTNGKDGAAGTNGKDGKDGKDGSVVTIGENGNWFIDGEDTGLAAQGEDGVPGAFYVPNPETGCFDVYAWDEEKGEYVVTPTEISFLAPGTITAVYDPETGVLTLFNVEGGEGELGIVTIGGTASEVATIEFVNYPKASLAEQFVTVPVTANAVFGKGLPGEITFTKGEQVQRPTVTPIVVKVTPANYELKPEDIVLVDTKGEVLDIVVANVKKHTGLDTKATTETGLWDVTFELTEYNKTAFDKAVLKTPSTGYVAGNYKAFAVKAGESVTEFNISFQAGTYRAAGKLENMLYLDKKVAGNVLDQYKDRATTGAAEKDWDPVKVAATPQTAPTYEVDKPAVNTVVATSRVAKPNYNAVVGEPIKIFSDGFPNTAEIKAMYVVLDIDKAVGSGGGDVSEKNAWNSYSYSGLNQVVEGKEISICINSEAAKGDEIGFRVFAVNWNGTLIDPDGCAFYVRVGGAGSEWSSVATVMSTAPDYIAGTSAAAKVNAATVTGAATYDFVMDDTKAPVFNIALCDDKGVVLGGVVAPGTNVAIPAAWTITAKTPAVKTIKGVPALALWNYADGTTYTGTLTFKDGLGFALVSVKVSFTKEVPATTPAGFSIKTGQLDETGTYNCYLEPTTLLTPAVPAWAATTADAGVMGMENIFNFPAGLAGNYVVSFADADEATDDGKNYYTVPSEAYGNGFVVVANKLANLKTQIIDNTTPHATTVSYDYGDVSSVAHKYIKDLTGWTDAAVTASGYADVQVPAMESFPTIFNCIYNSTYTWDWHWGKNDPSAKPAYYAYNAVWATEIAAGKALAVTAAAENEVPQIVYEEFDGGSINMKWILGNCGWDSKYSADLSAPYLASLVVNSAKLTSDANGVEDYYTVAVAGTAFTFTKKSGASNPTVAVPSTLTIKCKDMYNHDVTIKLAVKVMPRK